MSKRILDDQELSFTKMEDVKTFLKGMYEDQVILTPAIEETGVVYIPNNIFMGMACEKVEFIRRGCKVQAASISTDTEINRECIEGNGIFYVVPYGNKLWCFPTQESAYLQICQRAGDDCQTMRRFDETAAKKVLPTEVKAARLTQDLQLYSDGCLVLVRWGKVRAVLSKQYVVLPADKLLETVKQYTTSEFPDWEFRNGTWSHEFFRMEFDLNDEIREEEFRMRLEDFNVHAKEVKTKLVFYTSDIGLSSAVCRCYYSIDGNAFLLPGKVEVPHTGEATVALFGDKVKNHLKGIFEESEEMVEKLGNIPITDISEVLKRIQEKHTFISKEFLGAKVDEIILSKKFSGTAIDVYMYLNEIVQKQLTSKGASVREVVETTERLSKLLYLPYRSIDSGDEW